MIGKTLTGLEAIRLMEEGSTIIENCTNNPRFFKIEDDVIKTLDILSECWVKSISFDLSLTYEEYIEPKYIIGWKRAKPKESYFAISGEGVVCISSEDNHKIDDVRYNIANYFSTEEKAEEINFKQTLFRKLQRFSDENGKVDWENAKNKYFITFSTLTGKMDVQAVITYKVAGSVYFISEAIAQQAIELFHDDLIKYFTM